MTRERQKLKSKFPNNETPCIAISGKQKYHFVFYKNEKQEGKTGPAWEVRANEREEDVGKVCRRVNMVLTLCTHICKWKNKTC
jgi:hypothetical protein